MAALVEHASLHCVYVKDDNDTITYTFFPQPLYLQAAERPLYEESEFTIIDY